MPSRRQRRVPPDCLPPAWRLACEVTAACARLACQHSGGPPPARLRRKGEIMRHLRWIALAAAATGLVLASLAPALPAAASPMINIQTESATGYQYVTYCNGSTCNLQRSTQL